ncbi:sensor histidine kinase [Ferruginibacter sp.]|uniref:sensor histidine kinase n=1 Tax=Ferruginibacter sp. TaxID=1940288 RepID=UPI00374DD9D0
MNKIFGLLYFVIIWFLSSIICLAHRYRQMEQRNKEMKVQQLNAELSYLKAQINPHFLFNTLNNIYSLAICENEQTPEAILKLSAIMRYVTDDATADTVPLQKEIDYLQNYIALQQLRSNNKLEIKFTISGDLQHNKIAPLLLINFIENAFKYGVSNHLPCYVDIEIFILNNNITLKVNNKIISGIVTESTATGANNTLRRLELQYPNKHSLQINDQDHLYKIILQINLA